MRLLIAEIMHNHPYPGIIPAHSGIFKILRNPGTFKTVAYPEP